MANLGHIQYLLNTSEVYHKRFLDDPVAALADEGLRLSFEMQLDIRRQVRRAQASAAASPGTTVGAGSPNRVTTSGRKKGSGGNLRHEYIVIRLKDVLTTTDLPPGE